ncbi:MAG: DUF2098 domain-containing protein [Methanospirillaceae archaeon]|nr:DUF2098 domain-containing protein [Methanospirillaceae archaeon]
MTPAIQPGQTVRYPRTGTSGVVVSISDREGVQFAELDSTGLLYRIDQLVPAQLTSHTKTEKEDDSLEQIRKERESDLYSEQIDTTSLDGACSGAG